MLAKEVYEKLGELFETHPELEEYEISASGAEGMLRILQNNDGEIVGLMYEETDYVENLYSDAEDKMIAYGYATMNEDHFEVLTQMVEREEPEADIKQFIITHGTN